MIKNNYIVSDVAQDDLFNQARNDNLIKRVGTQKMENLNFFRFFCWLKLLKYKNYYAGQDKTKIN